jgi:hypothetical protein
MGGSGSGRGRPKGCKNKTQDEIDAAQAAAAEANVAAVQTQMKELTILSPCDCIVEAISLRPGDLVPANAPAVTLLDLTREYIDFSLHAAGARGGAGVEWQTVGTGLLGLFLLGAMAMAVGMCASALTESVIVAALASLILLLALWVVTVFTIGVEGPVRDLVGALSASEHLGPFLAGRIELKDVVYYLSFVALGLYLTDRALEGHRWA